MTNIIYPPGPVVSVFENTWKKEPIGEVKLSEWLFDERHKPDVEAYRTADNPKKPSKDYMPCISPAGVLEYRWTLHMEYICELVQPSGMVCVDIGAERNRLYMRGAIDWEEAKQTMAQFFPSLYYAGLSLGGDGIFLIFRIGHPDYHNEQYAAISDEIQDVTGLKVNFAPDNVMSKRIVSYDPNPYFNSAAKPYLKIMHNVRTLPHRWGNEKEEIRERVKRYIDKIQSSRTDIVKNDKTWLEIGCALASEFGEEGREYFHKATEFYSGSGYGWGYVRDYTPGYSRSQCDLLYSKCLNRKDNKSIGSFFHHCKDLWKK